METFILRIENLTKRYENGFSLEISHLEFQTGKIYSLVGPNGAGKTTLLNIINLLEEPTSGELFYLGHYSNNSTMVRRQIHQKMTMVMENPFMFHTSVQKNITYGLKIRAVDKKMWDPLVKEVLGLVGLEGFEKRNAYELSRGETQRVAIARALIVKPEILLLDEPFTNIDKQHINLMEDLIKTIRSRDMTTIILTTHDHLQAYKLSDSVISFVNGKIVNGSLENLFKGRIEKINDTTWVLISTLLRIAVVTKMTGNVHISIPPQDIILSYNQFESSARNSFKGMIKKIHLEDQTVRVSVDITSEIEFIALITKQSLEKMNLTVGSYIYLTFKSTSVLVF